MAYKKSRDWYRGQPEPWRMREEKETPPTSYSITDRRPKNIADGKKWFMAKRSTYISMNDYWNFKINLVDKGWSIEETMSIPGSTETQLQVLNQESPSVRTVVGTVKNLCTTIQPKNKELVTKVTAKAKEAEYDLLSELGELPETVRMFHDLVKSLKKPVELVKKHKEFLKKAQKWDQNWQKELSKLRKRYEKARSVESKKVLKLKYDILFKKQNPFGWSFRRKKKESLLGYAKTGIDKATETWLLYRYGLMPLWYSARDIMSAMHKRSQVYKTNRGKTVTNRKEVLGSYGLGVGFVVPFTRTTIAYEIEWSETDRVTYKQCFDGNVLGRLIGINPLVTAWELTTLSFVVDWFIQVGDFLQAISPSYAQQTEVVYSRKIKGTVRTVITQDIPWTPPSKSAILKTKRNVAGVSGVFESYRREPIDPMSHLTIPAEVQLNWKRELDAFALTWTRLRPFLETAKKEPDYGKIQLDSTQTKWRGRRFSK